MSTPEATKEYLHQLYRLRCATRGLPTLELEVLADIAERIVQGFAQYGPLTLDKRHWPAEGFEEFCDAIVYFTMDAKRRNRDDGV